MKIVMLKGVSGSGKGQPINSIIPTPNGDKKIGKIKVGDYVFGANGKPTKVLGVFPRGMLPVYKVTFEDGSNLIVDGDHIWTFEGRKKRGKEQNGYVKYNYTTKELYANPTLVNPKTRGPIRKHIPLVKSLEYEDDVVEIDPYVFGLYLADGSCGENGVVRVTKKEPGVVEYMLNLDDAPHNRHTYATTQYFTYPRGGNPLIKYLQKNDLDKVKSADKFIPEEWFHKSVEVRKRLLYGLMDGDGSLCRKKLSQSVVAKYSTTSELLKNGLIRLVTSLGGATKVTLRDEKRRPYWEIRIYTDFNPFLATHEVKEWKKRQYRLNTYRQMKSIEKAGYEEVVCIAVEAPDQLYVADTEYHIVTHNTTWANEQAKTGNFVVVSKDEIRKMFGGYKSNREKYVLRVRNDIIRTAVKLHKNVIVDDTNLNPMHERSLKQLAKELGCKFEINESFLNVSPEECIKRDLHRGEKAVGSQVIWEQYYKWVCPNPATKLNKNFDKPRCVIVDIDGTLALNLENRSFYDMSRVKEDTVDPFMSCIVDALYNYGLESNGKPYPSIILVSGRGEEARKDTEEWLKTNLIPYDHLYMREEGDSRKDEVIKEEIYHEYIEPEYAVLGVFDDRPCVCRNVWRKLGLRVAQLGFPEVDF